MKIVQTGDWHLGHTLHGAPRDYEHARFLEWLLDTIGDNAVDALLICGDIFDSANPPVRALRAWYEFLATARRRFPKLNIVAIGGNHDSAARLDAPNPMLDALDISVIGGPRRSASGLAVEEMLVPLTGRDGKPHAWVVAMPFLRPPDLPRVADFDADGLAAGVRSAYAAALIAAGERAAADDGPRLPVIAMGHLYLAATRVSELSERKVLGGSAPLPADIFGQDVTYGAFGHLHLAQPVGNHDHLRYSGSPIPLSLAERTYDHQVVLVELDGADLGSVEAIPVPRWVDIVRVPEEEALEPDEALARLKELEAVAADSDDSLPRPFLEVAVRLSAPRPGLRRDVEAALEGKGYFLAKITTEYTGSGRALGDVDVESRLDELTVEEVFGRLWARDHEGSPPTELLAALAVLHDIAEQEDAQ